MEPPKTPPGQILTTPTTPPKLHVRTPPPRISCDINTRDELGPFYWENRDKPPDFEVPPLKGGDFKERPTVEEWADKLGYKLPSGESVLAGRPDPSELKPGAKLPPSIEEIDRLLKKKDEDSMSLSGRSLASESKSKPGDFVKSIEASQEEADQKDSKPSSQKPSKPNTKLGAMLPPPLPAPRGLQNQADIQTMKPSSGQSNASKEEVGVIRQRLLKNTALLQEMMEREDPIQAEEERAKVFMERLPLVQAASRRLQCQLDVHGDETWPLPPLPYDRNPFILETNAIKIRTAVENCKDFGVTTDRESAKLEFLDVIVKSREKRVPGQAPKARLKSFEEEKKAREVEASNAIARMVDQGLQDELKELEEEGMSEVPSTPKSLFHSIPSLVSTAPLTSQESTAAASENEELSSASQGDSSVDTAERERREEWEELTRDPHFIGIGPYGVAEYDRSSTPDSANHSQATGGNPDWVYDENASPDPHYDSEGNSIPYSIPTTSNDDQEVRTPTQETETASAASEHDPPALAPPSHTLRALSVHDSEVGGMPSNMDEAVHNTQDKGKGRERSPGTGETMPEDPEASSKDDGASSSFGDISLYASQIQNAGKGKQPIPKYTGNALIDNGKERHGKMRGSGQKELDVAASLRNHSITFVDETQPKIKQRNPNVPQPEKMPNTLTEAICSYIPLEAKPILTLTLERVDPPLPSPTDQQCILLKHFEIGLDGVEGLCQGTAKIPETPNMIAERERRVGKLGTFKQGDGGFYRSLKRAQQKEQQYGKGYWYFFGVKFKQTAKERKLRKGGKWFLFGAPIEAVYHLDIKRSQENVNIMLGGGVDHSGTTIRPFKANFKRTHTLFSRGGLAPMDIWPGGEDWDDGVFEDIRAAMANNGLRVGFLYADTQTFPPRPTVFPAAGKNQSEKKRRQSGPDMTAEEMTAMEKSMKPKKLSDEDIATILTTSISKDRSKQDAALGRE